MSAALTATVGRDCFAADGSLKRGRYNSLAEAREAGTRLGMHAYECPDCGLFHLTRKLQVRPRQAAKPIEIPFRPYRPPTPVITLEPPTTMAKTSPKITKPAPKRGTLEAAAKWARWYLGEHGWAEHPKLMAEAAKAGHSDATTRKALKAIGARVQRRGPTMCALVHSPVEKGVEASTPASSSPSRSTESAAPTSVDVSHLPKVFRPTEGRLAVMKAWAKLEGMAEAMDATGSTKGLLAKQVAEVRKLVEALP